MLELRTQSDGTVQLHGLASRFDSPYRIGSQWSPHSFIERVAPGAFASSLSKPGFDCILTVEHSRRDTLARTPTTLKLTESRTGLEFDATLDMSDPTAQQAVGRIDRGVLAESSFAFEIPPGGDRWNADRTERTITNASIDRGDVSLVVYGASEATGASVVRSSESFEERRAFTDAISVVGIGGTGWEHRLGLTPGVDLSLRRPSTEKYTQEQIDALGHQGKALRNPDGSYSWPIVDREDLQNAIRAVGGRAQKTSPEKVRIWIMSRARALGLASLIPTTWRVDGSVKRSYDEFEAIVGEFEAIKSGGLEGRRLPQRPAGGPRPRDEGAPMIDHKADLARGAVLPFDCAPVGGQQIIRARERGGDLARGLAAAVVSRYPPEWVRGRQADAWLISGNLCAPLVWICGELVATTVVRRSAPPLLRLSDLPATGEVPADRLAIIFTNHAVERHRERVRTAASLEAVRAELEGRSRRSRSRAVEPAWWRSEPADDGYLLIVQGEVAAPLTERGSVAVAKTILSRSEIHPGGREHRNEFKANRRAGRRGRRVVEKATRGRRPVGGPSVEEFE